MLEKLISTSRSSFCKNWILQLRQDNKKRKTVCETLLLYLKSFGKTLKTAATNHVVYNSNRSEKSKSFVVNLCSVIAISAGGGLTSLRKFCIDLNLPESLTENSYNRYMHCTENFANDKCERSLKKVVQELRTLILSAWYCCKHWWVLKKMLWTQLHEPNGVLDFDWNWICSAVYQWGVERNLWKNIAAFMAKEALGWWK